VNTLTNTELEQIEESLWALLKNIDKENFPYFGICWPILDPMPMNKYWISRQYLFEKFKKWPMFSGNEVYPVPPPMNWDGEGSDNIKEFNESYAYSYIPKYEGEYGENRVWLILFLLEEIQKDLGVL
jgi:hypothetical protein